MDAKAAAGGDADPEVGEDAGTREGLAPLRGGPQGESAPGLGRLAGVVGPSEGVRCSRASRRRPRPGRVCVKARGGGQRGVRGWAGRAPRAGPLRVPCENSC